MKRETHESNIVGTTIKVKLPLTYEEDYYGNPLNSSIRDRIEHLYNSYALFNPHASFNYYHSDIDTHEELTTHTQDVIAEPAWRKFYPFDFPAPSWYDFDGFKNLIFAHINSDNIKPFGTFIREFKGLSASGKAKGISKRFKDVTTIADLTEENITDLLAAMKEATKPPLPSVLGIIGKDNLSKRIADLYPIEVFWYKKIDGYAGILPFVVEAIAATTSAEIGREIYTGLNFAPSYDDPFKDSWFEFRNSNTHIGGMGLDGLLRQLKVYEKDDFIFVLHVTTPVFAFRDRAKSTVFLRGEIGTAIAEVAYACCRVVQSQKAQRT